MIVDGSTQISEYVLTVFCNEDGSTFTQLDLKGNSFGEFPVPQVRLFFIPGQKGGFRARQTGNIVFNISDRDSFYTIYRMVQTEKPVFANWRFETEDRHVLSVNIGTSDEPLGEFE